MQLAERYPGLVGDLASRQPCVAVRQQPAAGRLQDRRAGVTDNGVHFGGVPFDRAIFPADTVSTHQIARPGVVQLHRWGLLPAVLASGAPAIRQVTFTAAGESVTL